MSAFSLYVPEPLLLAACEVPCGYAPALLSAYDAVIKASTGAVAVMDKLALRYFFIETVRPSERRSEISF